MTLTFPAGLTTQQSVQIPINDDLLVEPDESFNVQASSSDTRVMINSSPVGIVVATILDNDSMFAHTSYICTKQVVYVQIHFLSRYTL